MQPILWSFLENALILIRSNPTYFILEVKRFSQRRLSEIMTQRHRQTKWTICFILIINVVLPLMLIYNDTSSNELSSICVSQCKSDSL